MTRARPILEMGVSGAGLNMVAGGQDASAAPVRFRLGWKS